MGRLYLEDGLAHLPSLQPPPVGLGRINEYAVSGAVEGSQIKAVPSAGRNDRRALNKPFQVSVPLGLDGFLTRHAS